jgi:hypothetical protein
MERNRIGTTERFAISIELKELLGVLTEPGVNLRESSLMLNKLGHRPLERRLIGVHDFLLRPILSC